jgi:hypothetical protein
MSFVFISLDSLKLSTVLLFEQNDKINSKNYCNTCTCMVIIYLISVREESQQKVLTHLFNIKERKLFLSIYIYIYILYIYT